MKSIDEQVKQQLINDENYKRIVDIQKQNIQFFEAENVRDILVNYEEMSKGQFNPYWFNIKRIMQEEVYRELEQFYDSEKKQIKNILGEKFVKKIKEAYNFTYRTQAPKGEIIQGPKIIFLNAYANKIINFKPTNFSEKEFEIADHVEDILIKGNRELGLLIMQEWAKKQEKRSAQETKELKPIRNKGKKNSIGEVHLEKSTSKRPFSN